MSAIYNFSDKEIDNILYSTVRNKNHLLIRKKSNAQVFVKAIFSFLTSTDKNLSEEINASVLNLLPKQFVDLDKLNNELDGIDFDIVKSQKRSISLLEALLSLAFLLNFKSFQRLLFNKCYQITNELIKDKKLKFLICGHPTLLASFIGFSLNELRGKKNVITIQHGIYNLKEYKVLWFEKEVASHVIVYGTQFKDMYKSQGVIEENLIIGNPYFESRIKKGEKITVPLQLKKGKALFMGQQFYKVYTDISVPYNDAVSELCDFLKKKDIDVFYKPHPREDINKSLYKENITKLNFFNQSNKEESFLNDFDIYYSVNSTLLLETYLQKKICFQLDISKNIDLDRFSDYSGIPLINSKNISNHLDFNHYQFYYDSNYINLSDSPKNSVLKIFLEIFKTEEKSII